VNKSELIKSVEQGSLKKDKPYFEVGDTVEVHCKIQEGEKTRVQLYTGTVIAKTGSGMGANFTVRRIVNDEGVERVFPVNSPNVVDVKAIQSGKVRRSKLFFLRKRVGKAVRLQQRHASHSAAK
jgi:large subunit ribosomal protein L19